MAVYTHIDEAAIRAHLERFNIGQLVSFAGIAEGVENTNYKLVTSDGAFILTLFEKRVKAEDLPFFIAFMEHLHDRKIPSAGVVSAKGGRNVLELEGKPSIITTFLHGNWLREIDVSHARAVGTTLAWMHQAGETFPQKRENTMALPQWKKLISACAGKTDLLPLLEEELAYIEAHMPQGLPRGAVHADLFPDNVFFEYGTLSGVIDFYFACTETFAYDLMITLNAWCFEADGFNAEKARAMLNAYQRERGLTAAERDALPFYGRAAALRIIATRLYDWLHRAPDALVRPKDPQEYVEILRFHQNGGFQA